MKQLRILSTLLFACLFALPLAFSQDISTQGTEFWVSFMGNGFKTNGSGYVLTQLMISSKHDCTGTISNPQTGWSQNFTVRANNITSIDIPVIQGYNETSSYETASNKGLQIVTTDIVSVYCTNIATNSFDASYVLPVRALADDYIIQTYEQSTNSFGSTDFSNYLTSAFLIVATEDNTIIDITPSTNTLGGRPANEAFSVTLQKGESYQVRSTLNGNHRDLSGSRVTSRDCSKPIAVFNGNTLTTVPNVTSGFDHIFEQAMPLRSWGKKFVVTQSSSRRRDFVKVTSSANDNIIKKNGTVIATLQVYESLTFELSSQDKSCYIETTVPSAVYLYNTTSSDDYGYSHNGDPSMLWISPIEQRMTEVTFTTFSGTAASNSSIDHQYVNIIVASEDINNVTFDNDSIPSSQFEAVNGNEDYKFTRKGISHNVHQIACPNGFNAHVYGFGEDRGYAYLVGSNAADLSTTIIINGETVQQLDTISNCSLDPITFEAEINYQNFEVEWDFGDGTPPSYNITDQHTYSNYGLYEVTLTVTSEETLCQSSSSITQTVYINLNHASETTIHANTCYDGPSTYNQDGFSISYNTPGIYKDTITISQQGCDSIVYLILEVDDLYDDPDHPLVVETCNSYHWMDSTYRTSGKFPKTLTSTLGCDSIVYLDLTLSYSPTPNKIQPYPNNGSTVWSGDPDPNVNDIVYVVTNTEFFSFQYTFRVKESKHDTTECLWNRCKWSINKPSWAIDTIPGGVQIENDSCFSDCTVYVAERDEDYVILTAIISNGCDSDTCRIYLKSSFLDIDDQNIVQSDFNVIPNPNNGEMDLHLEQLTGKVSIKVYDMQGALVDVIETYNDLDAKTLHYAMEHTSSGIYFFVATAKEGTIAKKVIIE